MAKKAVKKGPEAKIITTVELPAQLLNRLRALGKLEDRSVSHYIRKGLGLFVESRLKARDATPEIRRILKIKE
jgi:Arc/MetJ-type ribon-helix-helix transcriptional regulator